MGLGINLLLQLTNMELHMGPHGRSICSIQNNHGTVTK